ncbi:MAG: M48 family metallopeptidase, partial [Burkholderiales bacterium]|nr:M48 family metallopeptidase [Burkholderiales bacterium]
KKFEFIEKGTEKNLSAGMDFQIKVPVGSRTDKKAVTRGLLDYLGPACHKYFLGKIQNIVSKIGNTGRPFTNLRLSSALTRWGTCKANGTIFLNWRLIMMDEEFLNYVICHELAHLKVMRHDNAFWNTVKEYCPDYREVENRMKKYSLRNFPF